MSGYDDDMTDREKTTVDAETGGGTALMIRRPVLAIVISLLIVVAGLAGLYGAEIRELPDVDRPVITVTTGFAGAAPETVDRELTAIVEGAIARVAGVASMSSTSTLGRSRVTVEFSDSTDLNVAASDVRDALGRVTNNMPDGADDPRIVKADANSDPVMRLAVTSDRLQRPGHDNSCRGSGGRPSCGDPGRRRCQCLWRPREDLSRRRRPVSSRRLRPDAGRSCAAP
jgi:hypothetical protein